MIVEKEIIKQYQFANYSDYIINFWGRNWLVHLMAHLEPIVVNAEHAQDALDIAADYVLTKGLPKYGIRKHSRIHSNIIEQLFYTPDELSQLSDQELENVVFVGNWGNGLKEIELVMIHELEVINES